MKYDREHFFNGLRVRFMYLSRSQVAGYDAIFDWADEHDMPPEHLAYVLATAYHETGKLMQPVREGFCKTDAGSIKAVTKLYSQGKIKTNYALPELNGQSYFGRGLVQITWGKNYLRVGKAIGMGTRLYDYPSLALDLGTAVKILCVGMRDGLFTGKKLDDYINDDRTDYREARRIINGLDKADKIAEYANKFYQCLI